MYLWIKNRKMISMLVIFTLYLISAQGQDVKVKGYEGGSVIMNYNYDTKKYSNHTKYICKVKDMNCKNILSQTEKTCDVKEKFFAMDDGPGAFYSFLIRNLSQEDAGKYRFGVESQNGSQFNVELDVEYGRYYGKPCFSQTIDPGDVVTFSCTYPPGHENDMKVVYKVTSQSITPMVFTYADYEEKDRYVLHVSLRDSIINMSISNVTVDDGGLYLCGVLKKNPLYASIFGEMQLQVTATGNISSPGSSGIITMVYVGVALLLITGFALFAYKLSSIKTQGALLPADTGNPVNSEGIDPGYYERIQDTQAVTIYAVSQKPKTCSISSDVVGQDFYSMIQLSEC